MDIQFSSNFFWDLFDKQFEFRVSSHRFWNVSKQVNKSHQLKAPNVALVAFYSNSRADQMNHSPTYTLNVTRFRLYECKKKMSSNKQHRCRCRHCAPFSLYAYVYTASTLARIHTHAGTVWIGIYVFALMKLNRDRNERRTRQCEQAKDAYICTMTVR